MGEFTQLFYEILTGLSNFYQILTSSINEVVGTEITVIGDMSLISFMLGSGLSVFVGYTLTAWIIDILP